jgi:hypothetical protein
MGVDVVGHMVDAGDVLLAQQFAAIDHRLPLPLQHPYGAADKSFAFSKARFCAILDTHRSFGCILNNQNSEVRDVKRWWMRGSIVLLALLMMAAVVGEATTSYSTWSGRYRVGETVLFKVEDESSGWWWGCCCQCTCSETQVLGWHIANSSGQTIYTVVHDAPVAASLWQGSWTQIDSTGMAVPAGEYMLYVDTSVGTLSRSFRLYDPCSCYGCWGGWWNCNRCNETATITTNCYCRTSLVLLKELSDCCGPTFRWPCCSNCP